MAREKTSYHCGDCGYISPSYLGRCPECQNWNSFVEQTTGKAKAENIRGRNISLTTEPASNKPLRLSDVQMDTASQYSSGFPELDRVLGGGVMPGGYVLVGGDPGIGKSTLMLQVASKIGHSGKRVLYIAGEESPYQIKMRAQRLGLKTEAIMVLPATNIHAVLETIKTDAPDLVVVDSIQSMYCGDVNGTPGSVSQIKECAALLMEAAKTTNTPIFLIGHVTKDGSVGGPKLLEHTVDAVLYFEGDKYQNLRILRAVKNRFGSTQEIGVFEMREDGLREIDNPSELFLSESSRTNPPGSVVVATVEGSRPILVEIQALVGQSTYPSPRRIGNGVEHNRLHQIVAVLERRLGLDFSRQDVYVNVVGGMRIDEPAADLAIAIAIISSHRNLSVLPGTVVTGEIGLTGEIRPVRNSSNRTQEASRIGFKRLLAPKGEDVKAKPAAKSAAQSDFRVITVETLADAIRSCFAPQAPGQPKPATPHSVETRERLPEADADVAEALGAW